MAEEQATQTQATPEQTPTTEASIGAKLQRRSGGQAIADVGAQPVRDSGQAATKQTPESNAGSKADGKADQKSDSKADTKLPAFDETQINWAKSKGIDVATLDPKHEGIAKLLQNAYNAESEMSKAKAEVQKFQNQTKAKEIAEAAKQVPDPNKPAAPNAPKSKIQEFEDSYKVVLDNILYMSGVDSLEALRDVNPQAAGRFNDLYLKGRQEAWEANQAFMQEQAQKQAQEFQAQQRFKDEMQTAKTAMQNNLIELKKANPDVEKHLESAGVNAILDYFESAPIYWPREYIMSNPKLVNWFTKAAKAINLLETLPDRDAKLKAEWEKSLAKTKEGELPPAGGSDSMESKIGAVLQRKRGGGVIA